MFKRNLLNLRRSADQAHKVAHPAAIRLQAMIDADRSESGHQRLDLKEVTRKPHKNIAAGVVPPETNKSKKPTTSARKAQRTAVQNNNSSVPTSQQSTQGAQAPYSLEAMELEASRILARLEVGSMERFRQHAKLNKLSVARSRNKECFTNPDTQSAWLLWKEAEKQCLIQGLGAFKAQLAQCRQTLHQLNQMPVVSHDPGNELVDMTVIIKRLSFALHRAAPDHDLASKAMDYLHRHNLLNPLGIQ